MDRPIESSRIIEADVRESIRTNYIDLGREALIDELLGCGVVGGLEGQDFEDMSENQLLNQLIDLMLFSYKSKEKLKITGVLRQIDEMHLRMMYVIGGYEERDIATIQIAEIIDMLAEYIMDIH